MALDKLPPAYSGDDRTLWELIEYVNYLREQMAHELELLKREAEKRLP